MVLGTSVKAAIPRQATASPAAVAAPPAAPAQAVPAPPATGPSPWRPAPAQPAVAAPRRRRLHLHHFRFAGEDPFSSSSLYACRCGVVRPSL